MSSLSANNGIAPQYEIALAVAIKDKAGQMTMSPTSVPTPIKAACSADVPFTVAMPKDVPQKRATSFSSFSTYGPTDETLTLLQVELEELAPNLIHCGAGPVNFFKERLTVFLASDTWRSAGDSSVVASLEAQIKKLL